MMEATVMLILAVMMDNLETLVMMTEKELVILVMEAMVVLI